MELPMKRAEINKSWGSQKIGMLGGAGIGKSEFFSYAPNCLYVQTEAGLNHLNVIKQPVGCWEDFSALGNALIKAKNEGKFPYETIIIDTIDRLVDFAFERACELGREKFKSAAINTVGDIPNGAGWAWSTGLVENALTKLEGLPACIIYIGHPEFKDIVEDGLTIKRHTISIGGKIGRKLVHWPDHLLNMQSKMVGNEIKRKFCTIPTNSMDAKSRGSMVPNNWMLTADTKENWEKFRALFE